jgi:hypothetical protein
VSFKGGICIVRKSVKNEKAPYKKKIGNTIYVISTHYSGIKNIVQKLGEIMVRDFKSSRAK